MIDQDDLDFTPVPAVDESWRVHDAETVPRCEARSWRHEPGVPVGDRHRDPRRRGDAFSGLEPDPAHGVEIDPAIAGMGVARYG